MKRAIERTVRRRYRRGAAARLLEKGAEVDRAEKGGRYAADTSPSRRPLSTWGLAADDDAEQSARLATGSVDHMLPKGTDATVHRLREGPRRRGAAVAKERRRR